MDEVQKAPKDIVPSLTANVVQMADRCVLLDYTNQTTELRKLVVQMEIIKQGMVRVRTQKPTPKTPVVGDKVKTWDL